MANVLVDLGVKTGDRVVIYLPMVTEAVFAMLACARIGAPHSVVFGGFSADALRSRIEDAEARVVITADGQNRRGKQLPLKNAVDEALASGAESAEKVLVVRRTGTEVDWTEGRDVWWHEVRETASTEHEPVWVEAEHPLFILYTSAPPGSPRASSTPPAATSPSPPTPTAMCSTSSRRPTCTGAPLTSAGSPATPTWCTGPWPTVPPR